MNRLLTGYAHELANYALRTPREARYEMAREVVMFARHMRGQPIEQIERMPYPRFRSYLRVLSDVVEKEWDSPDD